MLSSPRRLLISGLLLPAALLLSGCSGGGGGSSAPTVASTDGATPGTSQPVATANTGPDSASTVSNQSPVILLTLPLGTDGAVAFKERVKAWKDSGVAASVTLLEHTPSAQPADETALFAAMAIMRFADEAALAQWEQGAATALGADVQVRRADVLVDAGAHADAAKAMFVVNHYGVLVDRDAYAAYTQAYIVPNMANQHASGVMAAYTMYLERAAAGAQPRAVLVKEYHDQDSMVRSDAIKDAHKKMLLETNPEWKRINDTKEQIRTDLSETVANAKA